MKKWPNFNSNGDLPPGIHQGQLAEVVDHFGKDTHQRRILAQRLEHIYTLAAETGHLSRFIIFGSFITNKSRPADIDVFLLMEDTFDASKVSGETAVVFDHVASQNYEGASIFWTRRLAALGGEKATVEYWQRKRGGKKRGIVEVINND